MQLAFGVTQLGYYQKLCLYEHMSRSSFVSL